MAIGQPTTRRQPLGNTAGNALNVQLCERINAQKDTGPGWQPGASTTPAAG
jgi:hypothetical protein